MPDLGTMKLGKLPPKHDDRTLKLGDYLEPEGIPTIPASRSWDASIASWGMMGNDRIGDCTCAAVGHQVQTWTANASSEVTIADADIIAAYSAVSGYDPRTGANDNGAYELDVLNYWRKSGVGGHKLGAYAKIDVSRHGLVSAAIDLFGGVYIGVDLPLTAQDQIDRGQPWDAVSTSGRGVPGSWGGHAVVCVDYDATGPTCITWGALQKLTWAFWDAYVDEAYGIIGPEWFKANAQAPSGFDLAALTTDLAEVSGQAPSSRPTTALLVATPNPATVGQPLTLSVAVAAADGSTPTGVVTITAGGQPSDSQLDAMGRYNEVDSPTTAGSFTATAQYRGDATHEPSTAAPVTVTVQPLPIPQPTHFVPSGPTADAWALLQQGGALAKAELALLLSTDPTGPVAPAWRYLLEGGDVQALLDAWGPYLHAEGAA